MKLLDDKRQRSYHYYKKIWEGYSWMKVEKHTP